MRATLDLAEERFGKSSLLQTDQGRELLEVNRKLAKGIAVGGEISRKKHSVGQKRLGFGQRLTDPNSQPFGIGAANGNQRPLILAGKQDNL